MIQRIQTIFMLLFVLVGVANFLYFPSEELIFQPLLGKNSPSSPYVSFLLALIVLLNIALYKKRLLQIRVNQFVWVVFTLFWGGFVYFILVQENQTFTPYLPDLSIAFVGEVALLLANRFIQKDEDLIRSIDRLR